MKTILVAVDGSEASLKGARVALEMAGPLGAQVALVYVVPPLFIPGDAAYAPMDDLYEIERKRGERVMEEVVKALGGAALKTFVKTGPPSETVCELARAEGSSLIVVGSTGKGAVKRLFVGSTADRLVHIAPCNVLVVR
jgi:nucleotide-binding universal stress UspA family protein